MALIVVAVLASALLPQLPAFAGVERGDVYKPDPIRTEKSVEVAPEKGKGGSDKPEPEDPEPQVAWPAAGRFDVAMPTGAAAVRAGKSPVRLGAAKQRAGVKATTAPRKVRAEVLDRAATKRAKVDGVLLRVARADGAAERGRVAVELDYAAFKDAYGGDWASRLRLVALPECAQTTPGKKECQPTPIPTRNDAKSKTLRGDVELAPASSSTLVAAAAADSGASGDTGATALSPSGTWTAGGSSGDFTWSYPFKLPPAVGGAAPSLALGYSSGSVDGRTASTNNQPSQIGEGFEVWPGYVERKYKGCAEDIDGAGNPRTGDQCFATENATISLNGRASELIKDDASGVWKLKNDDGSKVERLNHGPGHENGDNDREYWRVTTTNGTQYYFGQHRLPGWSAGKAETNSTWTVPVYGNHAGEQCHVPGNFEASWCQQAYRWNLDWVVDPNGNGLSYYYQREINHYGRNVNKEATPYTRGGYLDRIEYGLRDGNAYSPAPARVVFQSADRCVPGSSCDLAKPGDFPDVPLDKKCDGGTCPDKFSPTFWTTKRVAKVISQVWNTSAHVDVDSWTLTHEFPQTGDNTSRSLWLKSIVHTGHGGDSPDIAMPPVTFDPIELSNRVDGIDTLPHLYRNRIRAIHSESGGSITVDYSQPQCNRNGAMPPTPDNNTMRCMPTNWTPDGQPMLLDWFHKYVVTQVSNIDRVTGAPDVVSEYKYLGDPAWHFDEEDGLVPPEQKTWSQWRGYSRVRTISGLAPDERTQTETLYFRGMDDDKQATGPRRDVKVTDSQGGVVEDHERLQGAAREQTTFDKVDGVPLARTINEPWLSGVTANRVRPWGTHKALMLDTRSVTTSTSTESGWKSSKVEKNFDQYGIVTSTSDHGDLSTESDDQCVTYDYARNTQTHLLTLASRLLTVTKACGKDYSLPGDLVADVRTYYDGSDTLGAAPTRGNPTRSEEVAEWKDGAPRYVTTTRVVLDEYGRALETYDATGEKATTSYTPAVGGPITAITTTNALGHKETTQLDPNRGAPLASVDPNGKRTELEYDALGRTVKSWLPGRARSQTPNVENEYLVQNSAPSVVKTKTLRTNGDAYTTTYAIYDGLLRLRQTQVPSPGGGRVLADNLYDTHGRVWKRNSAYYNAFPPDTKLMTPVEGAKLPGQTRTFFDSAGRATAEATYSLGTEKTRTTISHGGDRMHIDPPDGGTATTTITDGRGRTIELRQYKGGSPTGAYDVTKYAYEPSGELSTLTDPAGNVWRYHYDIRGLKTKVEDPDRGATLFAYDDARRLKSTTDARGKTLVYAYDKLGRGTAVHEGTLSGPKRTSQAYDTLALGQVSSTTRFVGANAFTTTVKGYDDQYRPTGSRVTIPASEGKLAGSYEAAVTYNADGSPATATLPAAGGLDEEKLHFGYNELGMPITLAGETARAGKKTYVEETAYTKFAEPEQLALSTGGPRVWQTYKYEDGTRRLAESVVQREATGATQARTKYSYDPAGNLKRIADVPEHAVADVQCFEYDYLRRMTEAWTTTSTADTSCNGGPSGKVGGTQPYWHSYAYDTTGNRAKETRHSTVSGVADTVRTYTFPKPGEAQPHTLTSVTTTGPSGTKLDEFAYDAVGNTTSRKLAGSAQGLEWDAEGRLTKVTEGTKVTEYVYDASGARLLRRDPTGTTLYLGGMEVRLDKADNVEGTRYYSHAGQTVAVRTPNTMRWLVSDHNGTSNLSFDPNTLDVTRRRFLPFGEERGVTTSWTGEKGFVGGTRDPSTKLTNIGAREYDTVNGRFLSADPMIDHQNPQQLNGYAYANNSPVTFSDVTGLCSTDSQCAYEEYNKDPSAYNCSLDPRPCKVGDHDGPKPRGPQKPPSIVQGEKDQAEARKIQKKTVIEVVLEAGGEILKEILGINDIRSCFGEGDIGACIQVALNVIPWSKLGKIPALIKGIKKAWNAVSDFMKKMEWAKGILAKADELADATRRYYDEVAAWSKKAEDEANAAANAADDVAAAACQVNSFVPGTSVRLADGTRKPIEEVQTGDVVLATDPETGRTEPRKVVRTIIGQGQKDLVEITVDTDGPKGSDTGVVVATEGHRFWVDDQGRWIDAGDLSVGDLMLTVDGQQVRVESLREYSEVQTVHNLTVQGIHTYYVTIGDVDTLVHNCGEAAAAVSFTLKYKKSWTAAQRAEADSKVAALNNAQQLVVTSVTRSNRQASTWRSAGNSIPAGNDIDHIVDLQLGGQDVLANLQLLDSSVNRSLGAQLSHRIRKHGLKPGDIVAGIVIVPR